MPYHSTPQGPPESDVVIQRWTEIASADLTVAEMVLESGSDEMLAQAGFHAQQAVEKMLKALLALHGVDPSETHDLNRLLYQVKRAEPTIPGWLVRVRDLTPYAVFHRYPPRVPPYDRDLDRATVTCDMATARAACDQLGQTIERHRTEARARPLFPEPLAGRPSRARTQSRR